MVSGYPINFPLFVGTFSAEHLDRCSVDGSSKKRPPTKQRSGASDPSSGVAQKGLREVKKALPDLPKSWQMAEDPSEMILKRIHKLKSIQIYIYLKNYLFKI